MAKLWTGSKTWQGNTTPVAGTKYLVGASGGKSTYQTFNTGNTKRCLVSNGANGNISFQNVTATVESLEIAVDTTQKAYHYNGQKRNTVTIYQVKGNSIYFGVVGVGEINTTGPILSLPIKNDTPLEAVPKFSVITIKGQGHSISKIEFDNVTHRIRYYYDGTPVDETTVIFS